MNTTVLNVRISENLKAEAQKVAKEMGLPLSSLVSALLTQTVRTKKIELSLETENGFSPQYEDLLLQEHKDKTNFIHTAETEEDIDHIFHLLEQK